MVIHGGVRILMDGCHWRVYDTSGDIATMINMDVTRIDIRKESIERLDSMVAVGAVEICEDQMIYATPDEGRMTERQLRNYRIHCGFIERVLSECRDPLFSRNLEDVKGSARETFLEIAKEFGLSPKYAWRNFRAYLQSGFQRSSLVDRKYYGGPRSQHYRRKNGRRPAIPKGKVLTDIDIANMDKALEMLKLPGYKVDDAYIYLMDRFYSTTASERKVSVLDDVSLGGVDLAEIERDIAESRPIWLPPTERPTIDQFRYRKRKLNMTEEIKEARMGEAAYRNSCRRLTDSPRRGLRNIGDLAEVDHCELDIYAVSATDPSKGIGKPVMHAMVDTLTGVIMALTVSLNNNSEDSLTRLLINAFEDKGRWAAKHGIKLENMDSLKTTLLPTFMPRVIRADRGSDFKSDKFERFCMENDIDLQLVPGAMGSYKPHIERLFHSFHESIEASLVRKGFITRRYRDNSKREAMLTLKELTAVCIVFATHYNQHLMPSRRCTGEQMADPNFRRSPIGFFRYYLEHGDAPRTILETQRDDLIFSLMDPMDVDITRNGISYDGLVYDEPADDPDLTGRIAKVNGKDVLQVRRDPFDTSVLWYRRDRSYGKLTQNPGRSIGFGSLSGITWKEFEEYKALERARAQKEQEQMLAQRSMARKDTEFIVGSAAKPMLASDKDIKRNRKTEQMMDNSGNGVVRTLGGDVERKPEPAPAEVGTDEYIRLLMEDPDKALDEANRKARK